MRASEFAQPQTGLHDSGREQLPRGSSRRPKHRGRPAAQCGPGGAEVEASTPDMNL